MDNIFLAMDADNAGRMVGRAVLANDVAALTEVSSRIDLGQEIIARWVQEQGGKKISAGGDEFTAQMPPGSIETIEELRKDYQFATNLTMTVGVGKDLSQAGKSLMAGKLRGKNIVVIFDETVDSELQSAHLHAGDGTGSEEENKLDEAYLSDGQQNEQGEDAANDGQGEFSDGKNHDSEANREAKGDDVGPGSTEESPGEGVEPTATDQQAEQNDQQAQFNTDGEEPGPTDPKAQSNPKTEGAEKLEEKSMNDKSNGNSVKPKNKEIVNEGSKEKDPKAGQENVDKLKEKIDEASPESQSQEKDVMENIDDADLATGHADGKGVDDKDSDQTPGDMGLGDEAEAGAEEGVDPQDPSASEEEGEEDLNPDQLPGEDKEDPDYKEVLGDAIASEQENIQKEKVVQMVAEALEVFKSQRHILERAKEQAPELYNGSIKMLRAMIEMSKLLGFGDGLEDPEHDAQQNGADSLFGNDEDMPADDEDMLADDEDMLADDKPFLDGSDSEEGAEDKEKPASKPEFPPKKDGKSAKPDVSPDAKGKPSFPPKKPEGKPAGKKPAGQ